MRTRTRTRKCIAQPRNTTRQHTRTHIKRVLAHARTHTPTRVRARADMLTLQGQAAAACPWPTLALPLPPCLNAHTCDKRVCTCVYVCVCTCVCVCVCMCVTPCVSQMGSVRGAVERQDAESQLLLLAFSHELTLCGGQGLNAPAAESMRPLCGRNVAQTSGVVKKGDLTLTGREGGAVGLGEGRGT